MTTQEDFKKALQFLDKYYTNFNFDFNDMGKIAIWHSKFKAYDYQNLVTLFKAYADNNIFPPKSPTEIIEYFKRAIRERGTSAEQTFDNMVEELITNSKYYDYRRNAYDLNTYIEEKEDRGLIPLARTVRDLKSEIQGMMRDSNKKTWVRKEFLKIYEEEVKFYIRDKVIGGKVAIGNDSTIKLLGKKEKVNETN